MEEDLIKRFEEFCEDLCYWADDDMGGHWEAIVGDQVANTSIGYLSIKRRIENILNRLEQQNNNINNTIKAIEILRQDFSEDLQVEFINLLNTLTGGEYLK